MAYSCDNCSCLFDQLLICSRCKSVRYCNSKCQKDDWSYHKTICFKAAPYQAINLKLGQVSLVQLISAITLAWAHEQREYIFRMLQNKLPDLLIVFGLYHELISYAWFNIEIKSDDFFDADGPPLNSFRVTPGGVNDYEYFKNTLKQETTKIVNMKSNLEDLQQMGFAVTHDLRYGKSGFYNQSDQVEVAVTHWISSLDFSQNVLRVFMANLMGADV